MGSRDDRFTGAAVQSSRALKQITDDLLRYVAFIQGSMTPAVANRIGDAVVGIMLDLISKGISPIEGAGRFPAYKWAAFASALKKEKTEINRALKKNRKSLFVFRRMNQRQLIVMQKKANQRDTQSFLASKYPYSAMKKFPGKRPRPVNLFLSGDFLNHLIAKVRGAAGTLNIEVGFFDEKSAVKEQGHREGANTQPERPIIPINREEFAAVIQDAIWQIIEQEIDRVAKSGAS